MDPISIHPMLRFIGYVFLFVIHERGISIHPMLRFILSLYAFVSLCSSFQYIPCYGLSCNHQHQEIYMHIFQYIPCYGLSFGYIVKSFHAIQFQYIPCYGLSNDFKPFLSWHLSSFPLFYVISTFFTSRL